MDIRTLAIRAAEPRFFAPLFLLSAVALSIWFADQNLPIPDEGAALSAAARILKGQVFYRDMDAYVFPGSTYLLVPWMAAFGEHVSSARALAGLAFCAFATALYACALQLLDRRSAALYAVALLSFKFLAFPNFTAFMYSDFALASGAAAILVFLRGWPDASQRSLAATGALAGLTILFKQNTGIYLAIAMGALVVLPGIAGAPASRTLRARLLGAGAFALGMAAAAAPALLYFASEGVAGQMLYSGLIRPFTGYLPTSGVPFSPPLAWWEFGSLRGAAARPYVPLRYLELIYLAGFPPFVSRGAQWFFGELFTRLLYTSIPIAFALWVWRWSRTARRRDAASSPLIVYALLAFTVVGSAFPRADFPHVINVYPVFLLAGFCLLQQRPRTALPSLQLWSALGATALLSVSVAVQTLWYDRVLTHRLELDRASLRIRAEDQWVGSVVSHVRRRIPPDAAFFVYGHEAYLYFLTDRYFPWPFLQLYPGMTGGDGGSEIASLLERTRPALVGKGVLSWPGIPDLRDYAPALQDAIRRHYRVTEAWRAEAPLGAPLPPRRTFALLEAKPTATPPDGPTPDPAAP